MKYFGFIKEHDDYKYSVKIKDLIKEKNTQSPYREEVIEYLEKGNLCVAWMGGVEDAMSPRFNEENYEDNNFMGEFIRRTDIKT